jgi:hypothetical protein
MHLTSSAFSDQGNIPQLYVMSGAGGENVSIPLEWTDIPQGTLGLALSMVDPHPIANNWIHWLVINIPPDTTSLEQGASGKNMPEGAKELKNSFGKIGYGGPQPPKGTGKHPYVTTVYALNTAYIDLDTHVSLNEFTEALQGKILDLVELTGMFEQK